MSAITEFYALRLAPVALVAVVACSAPAGAPEDVAAPDGGQAASDAGTAHVDAASDAAAPDADAGAAIVRTYGKERVTVDADGVTLDTRLHIACAFSKAGDGVVRCLPAQAGVTPVGFTSDDCTGVVVGAPAGTAIAYFVDGDRVCQSDEPFETSAVLVAGDAGACTDEASLPSGLYFKCSSVITDVQFVAVTDVDQ